MYNFLNCTDLYKISFKNVKIVIYIVIVFHHRVIIPLYRLRGRVVKGVGHLGHEEAMETGGPEFNPRPGHYSRMSF